MWTCTMIWLWETARFLDLLLNNIFYYVYFLLLDIFEVIFPANVSQGANNNK